MRFEAGDLVLALFLLIVIWLALAIDGGWGGGKRSRAPA